MRILITGTTGYIARAFDAYALALGWTAQRISLRDEASWRVLNFEGYDAILHAAGLVHGTAGDFDRINRDLTLAVAQKAKAEGVPQFVFLSSQSVYGLQHLPDGAITAATPTLPRSPYGRSKLEAERLLAELAAPDFAVTVLRPPMVYGPGCPGNFPRLCRLVAQTPFFPSLENARSMVYIHNLCAHMASLLQTKQGGLFFPRDPAPIATRQIAQLVAQHQGRTLRLTGAFNGPIRLLRPHVPTLAKLFGNLVYDPALPTGGGADLIGFPAQILQSLKK